MQADLGILREVGGVTLGGWTVLGLASQGKDRTLLLLPSITSAAPSPLPGQSPPPHLPSARART